MEDAGSKRFIAEKNISVQDGVKSFERENLYSAAMTVYEKIFEDLNVSWCEDNIDILADEIFTKDIIRNIKNSGVTSDIDLAYITYLAALIGQAKSCEDDELWQFVNNYFNKLLLNTPEIYDYVANEVKEIYNFEDGYIKREGVLWKELEALYMHWYLGDKKFKEICESPLPGLNGKIGFVNLESLN